MPTVPRLTYFSTLSQRQQARLTQQIPAGRRKIPLRVEARGGKPPDRGPQTLDADRLEDLLVDEQERSAEEALKEISSKPKQ